MPSTLLTYLGLAVAGAVGAIARYVIDAAVDDRTGGAFPWGTLVVNLSAAILLGAVFALFQSRLGVPVWLRTTIQTGFLGTYSTFSTLTLETLNLLRAGSYLAGALDILGSVALGLLAVYVGTVVGRLI